jgi:hypothetical protein
MLTAHSSSLSGADCGAKDSSQGILHFPLCRAFRPAKQFAKPGRECFNLIIETGVLHGVGLRNTLEPDPDNTGVGSFLGLTAFFLET